MMQRWFEEAKFGIFIHYGIYAVKGIDESWAFFNKKISYPDYMSQLSGFTAAKYDPEAWADLFVRAGARYAVLTSKHHDGVALWKSDHSDLNVVEKTPAGRDLLGPYVEAMRKHGLHVGIYFSHLDWSHPDYAPMPPEERTNSTLSQATYDAWEGRAQNPKWRRFLQFHRAQLRELVEKFRPELLWFDGDWTPNDEFWNMAEVRKMLDEIAPGTVINSRLQSFGDYATPEQGFPIVRPTGPWEYCVTINDSWGYQPQDQNYKTPRQLIRILCEIVGMGGNLLLDVTPKEDGTIPLEQVELLEKMGGWLDRHGEAIFGCGEGLPAGLFYGSSTIRNDRKVLYLHVYDKPIEGVAVKGLLSPIRKATVLGSGTQLQVRNSTGAEWSDAPPIRWIDVPEREIDPLCTVLKLEFDEPLRTYFGAGRS